MPERLAATADPWLALQPQLPVFLEPQAGRAVGLCPHPKLLQCSQSRDSQSGAQKTLGTKCCDIPKPGTFPQFSQQSAASLFSSSSDGPLPDFWPLGPGFSSCHFRFPRSHCSPGSKGRAQCYHHCLLGTQPTCRADAEHPLNMLNTWRYPLCSAIHTPTALAQNSSGLSRLHLQASPKHQASSKSH